MAVTTTLRSTVALVATSAALAGPALGQLQSGSVNVLGTANIFAANGNTPAAPGGGGAGTAPTLIALTPAVARTLTFGAVAGTWSCGPGSNGPDGGFCAGASTDVNSTGKIAGIFTQARTMYLVGLFLDGGLPAAAPARLTYSAAALDAAAFGPPQLGQVFFIGDGQGTTGTQSFAIPDAATQLFLGVADAFAFTGPPGFYFDNSGSVTARFEVNGQAITAAPEPSSLVLAATGALALVGWGARRRSRG